MQDIKARKFWNAAVEAQAKHGWCGAGFRNAMEDIGLNAEDRPPKGMVLDYDLVQQAGLDAISVNPDNAYEIAELLRAFGLEAPVRRLRVTRVTEFVVYEKNRVQRGDRYDSPGWVAGSLRHVDEDFDGCVIFDDDYTTLAAEVVSTIVEHADNGEWEEL